MTKPSDLLDQAMERRRVELNLGWKDVAQLAGVSVETLTALRKGRTNAANANPLTKRGIERSLQWAAGGFDEALAGRKPRPAGGEPDNAAPPGPSPGADLDEWSRRFEGLTPEEQTDVIRELLAKYRSSLEPGREAEGGQRRAG